MKEQLQAETPRSGADAASSILRLLEIKDTTDITKVKLDDTNTSLMRSIGVTGTTLFTVDI